jgi:hypothetical protein
MRPAAVIVANEVLNVSVRAALVEYDHVIQALTANGADHPFDLGALPGCPQGRKHLFHAHCLDLVDEVLPEDLVTIPQQISRCRIPREGLAQLLGASRTFEERRLGGAARESPAEAPHGLLNQAAVKR